MIKHFVMWQIKDDLNKDETTFEMKKKLEKLKNVIPQILQLEVGIDIIKNPYSNFDIMIETHFKNFEDLKTYQEHPEHLKVVEYVKKVVKNRACVDYKA